MYEEIGFVEDIVFRYGVAPNNNVLSHEMDLLQKQMLNLIGVLRPKPISQHDLFPPPVFDFLTMILYKVLTAKNTDEIEQFCTNSKSSKIKKSLGFIRDIYELSQKDTACKNVIITMQSAFSGKVFMMASADSGAKNKELMIFSQQNQNPNTPQFAQLKETAEKAEENFTKTLAFLSKYKY